MSSIKSIVILVVIFCFTTTSLMSQNMSPIGNWKTIDDETGEVKSIVQIWMENDKLYGKITELFRKPDEDQNPTCAKGSGELEGKPMLGATILRDLKEKGKWWAGGKILDPKKGKTYKCKIKVIEDGEKLIVRGYIGFSLIGRSQTWLRVEEPIEQKEKPEEEKKSEEEPEEEIDKE